MAQARRGSFGSLRPELEIEAKPFLKWAGGKTRLLGQMQKLWPDKWENYLEPFVGGGAVFFHLAPGRAILGDLNDELMNCYRIVRNDPDLLMEALDEHEPHKTEKDYFYGIRAQDPHSLDPLARAARTIFLNKTCYNGLYRVNAKGEFNVPLGRYKNPSLYSRDNLRACCRSLQNALLEAGDYRVVLRYAHSDDFVYLDPPYQIVSKTANFTSYTKDRFSEENQAELALVFAQLDDMGCNVMLSNSDTPIVWALYSKYNLEKLRGTRPISSKASTRGEITELLITNYEPDSGE